MGKYTRIFAFLVAIFMMMGSVSLAETCGIGEAASYVPNETPAAVSPAVRTESTEDLSGAVTSTSADSGTKGFVTRMYQVVLGREPDPNGLETWIYQLESGRLGAADLVSRFFNSPEYQGKNKSSEAVVVDCYNAMLGRNPDPSGLEHWKAMLDIGMTSDKVCAGFLNSNEFLGLANSYGIKRGTIDLKYYRDLNYDRTAFVYRLYQDCLSRTPDLAGLEHWCQVLSLGSEGTSVARGFVFSTEYKNRLASNSEYVDMLYRTILGREADAAGKANWTNLLNFTSTREKVLNGFMFSPEFSAKCTKAGINVGKKIDEPDNTRAWQANILILSLVNAERSKVGAAALTTREDLWESVAMVRAEEVSKYFSHTRPNGTTCWTAYEEAGFPDSREAENIAFGFKTEKDVMNAWMNSSGHRVNILNTALTTLATGLFNKTNWSQNFYAE